MRNVKWAMGNDITAAASEHQLQAPQNLARIESRCEAERIAPPEIALPETGEPHCAGVVIIREKRDPPCEGVDRDRENLAHGGEVRAVEKIRGLCGEFDPRRAVLLEAERFTETNVDAAIVRPDAGVTPDVEEPVRADACVAIDVDPRQQRERNAAADEDHRAERDVAQRPVLERALKDAAEDEVVPDIEGRDRPLRREPRREWRRKGRVEIGLIVNRLAESVIGREQEVVTESPLK